MKSLQAPTIFNPHTLIFKDLAFKGMVKWSNDGKSEYRPLEGFQHNKRKC